MSMSGYGALYFPITDTKCINSIILDLLNLTPDLQFMNSPNTPQEALIRNEDHYGFLNFTQATDREELQK